MDTKKTQYIRCKKKDGTRQIYLRSDNKTEDLLSAGKVCRSGQHAKIYWTHGPALLYLLVESRPALAAICINGHGQSNHWDANLSAKYEYFYEYTSTVLWLLAEIMLARFLAPRALMRTRLRIAKFSDYVSVQRSRV